VVSTTINRYAYTFISPSASNALQIVSSDYNTFYRQPGYADLIWDGDLALPKAIIHHFGLRAGLEIFLASQVPPGTGLGSSGSVAVSMITALAAWNGKKMSRAEIAELACYIEIEKMGMPVGKQDQYAAAFGGLNMISFSSEGVTVEPLSISPETLEQLQSRLMLFFTGTSRRSSTILRYQKRESEKQEGVVVHSLHAIKELALSIREALEQGDLQTFGELLDLSWQNKKNLAPNLSNSFIDQCYMAAQKAGAVGGKITGAGGGGFLMLYCPEEYQPQVTHTLEDMGLRRMDFAFDHEGAQVLLNLPGDEIPWLPQWTPQMHLDNPLPLQALSFTRSQ